MNYENETKIKMFYPPPPPTTATTTATALPHILHRMKNVNINFFIKLYRTIVINQQFKPAIRYSHAHIK